MKSLEFPYILPLLSGLQTQYHKLGHWKTWYFETWFIQFETKNIIRPTNEIWLCVGFNGSNWVHFCHMWTFFSLNCRHKWHSKRYIQQYIQSAQYIPFGSSDCRTFICQQKNQKLNRKLIVRVFSCDFIMGIVQKIHGLRSKSC